jgi:RNA polymerase sigma factor (sigma-70 family)
MPDDAELLRRYAELGSQEAFTALVANRINLVYSIAIRQVGGNRHLAEEVVQKVFAELARKASKMWRHPMLTGWLFISTRYAANHAIRAEQRRQVRENMAFEQNATLAVPCEEETEWSQLGPIVDRILEQLPQRDRLAILMRYYENRSYAEIGKAIAASEDGTRMRVQRALDKLRLGLEKQGIRSTGAALGALLTENALEAAPNGLAALVAASSAASLAAPISLGVMHFMSTAKMISTLAAVAVLGTIGGFEWREQTKLASERHQLVLERERLAVQERQLNERLASPAHLAVASSQSTPSIEKETPNLRQSESKSNARGEKDAAMRKRYALFFKQRGLTPEQIDRFIDLLNQQAEARTDLQEAVRKEGLSDGPQVEAMRIDLNRPITDSLKQLLGDDGYSAFNAFQQTSFYQSAWVQPLEKYFLAENVPIDDTQTVQLTEIVASNDHPVKLRQQILVMRVRLIGMQWSLRRGIS